MLKLKKLLFKSKSSNKPDTKANQNLLFRSIKPQQPTYATNQNFITTNRNSTSKINTGLNSC